MSHGTSRHTEAFRKHSWCACHYGKAQNGRISAQKKGKRMVVDVHVPGHGGYSAGPTAVTLLKAAINEPRQPGATEMSMWGATWAPDDEQSDTEKFKWTFAQESSNGDLPDAPEFFPRSSAFRLQYLGSELSFWGVMHNFWWGQASRVRPLGLGPDAREHCCKFGAPPTPKHTLFWIFVALQPHALPCRVCATWLFCSCCCAKGTRGSHGLVVDI